MSAVIPLVWIFKIPSFENEGYGCVAYQLVIDTGIPVFQTKLLLIHFVSSLSLYQGRPDPHRPCLAIQV
jgi:hypothetical protein